MSYNLTESIKRSINLIKKIKIDDKVYIHYWGTNDPRTYIIKEINMSKIKVIHDPKGPLKNAPEELRFISEIISLSN